MITISVEFLNTNWKKLVDNKTLPIILSEWDDGETYVLSSMGVCPSRKEIYGAIVLGERETTEFKAVVQLIQVANEKGSYVSPTGESYKAIAYLNNEEKTKKENVKTCIVNVGCELSARNRGLIETDILKDSSVLIVGLGTGGIQIAIDLAKCGVGRFHLIDPDRLEIGNISRHHAGLSHIGRKKVLVARDLLLEKNPKVSVFSYPIKADESRMSEIQKIVDEVDVVICATDNRESKLLINSICVTSKKIVFFAGAFRRAYGGQILRVYPEKTACYHCFLLGMPDVETDREISSATNAGDIAYSDMPVAIEPGLAIDVEPIGTMTSKLVLQELIRNKESTLHILDEDFTANWYLWVNRRESGTKYASFPPLSELSDKMTILRWYGVEFPKDDDCPTCGNFEKVMREQYGLEPNESSLPESSSPTPDINL